MPPPTVVTGSGAGEPRLVNPEQRQDYGEKVGGARKDLAQTGLLGLSRSIEDRLGEVLNDVSAERSDGRRIQSRIERARAFARRYRRDSLWSWPTPLELAESWRAFETNPGVTSGGKLDFRLAAPQGPAAPGQSAPSQGLPPPQGLAAYLFSSWLHEMVPFSTTNLESGRDRYAHLPSLGWLLLGAGYGAMVEGVRDFALGPKNADEVLGALRLLEKPPEVSPQINGRWYRYSGYQDAIFNRYSESGETVAGEGGGEGWIGRFYTDIKNGAKDAPLWAIATLRSRSASALNRITNERAPALFLQYLLQHLNRFNEDQNKDEQGGDPIERVREILLVLGNPDVPESEHISHYFRLADLAPGSKASAGGARKKSPAPVGLKPIPPLITPVLGRLKDLKRIGARHRDGDVDERILCETFGVRAIEYGNWVRQDERQEMLNLTYDSLADMAQALRVDRRFIGFDGELALAFGARGSGGKAAAVAHYEPGRRVINLTRYMGSGTLAHEWAHALDCFLKRRAGGSTGYLSDAYLNSYCSEHWIADQAPRSPGPDAPPQACMREIFDAALREPESRSEDQAWPDDRLRGFVRSAEAQMFSPKVLMETADNVAVFQYKVAPNGRIGFSHRPMKDNAQLREIFLKTAGEWRARLAPLVENIRDSVIAEDGVGFLFDSKGNRGYAFRWQRVVEVVESAIKRAGGPPLDEYEHEFLCGWANTGAGYKVFRKLLMEYWHQQKLLRLNWSHYKGAAVLLDKGKVGKYWSQPAELWARAFSTVIHCRMLEDGNRNDFASLCSAPRTYSSETFIADPNLNGRELDRTLAAAGPMIESLQRLSQEMFERGAPSIEPTGMRG